MQCSPSFQPGLMLRSVARVASVVLVASCVFLAAASELDLDSDLVDTGRATCLLPIAEFQALPDSAVWKVLVGTAEQHVEKDVHMGREEGSAATVELLRMVNKSAAKQCSERGDASPWWQQYQSGTTTPSPLLSTPLLNDGKECFYGCELQTGNCSSGFCGRGVCCRQNFFHPDCPPEKPGCLGFHCCTDRASPDRSILPGPPCSARPGKFCLSTAVDLRNKSYSGAQVCALQHSISTCPPGFFCPGGQKPPLACPRGHRCPGGQREPLPCPVGYFCPISILVRPCPAGLRCDGNATKPDLCPGGSYCPHGSGELCPKGFFCAPGSTRPQRCARLARCPEGAEQQDFNSISRVALVLALIVWTAAITNVPRWLHPQGGLSGVVPTVVTLGFLSAAWILKLDVIYTTVKTVSQGPLGQGHDPKDFQTVEIFGSSPHTSPLIFLTMSYSILLYGLLVSVWIRRPIVRFALDSIVGMALCAIFNAYLRDLYALIFMVNLFVAFKVMWVLITQQGPLLWRLGLLGVAVGAVCAGFFLLDAPELGQLLLCAVAAVFVKAFLRAAYPEARRLILLLVPGPGRVASVCDAPLRPLMGRVVSHTRLPDDSEDGETNAAIVAAARASRHMAKVSWLETGALQQAADPQAWAMWARFQSPSCDSAMELQADTWSLQGNAGDFDLGALDYPGRSEKGVEFELRGLSLRIESGRRLLQDISFRVPAGATVAIMGASGAGKSTLLAALSGRCADGALDGQLLLNGKPKKPWQMSELRPIIGFVPQDDVVHSLLSVRENIEFQAELRLPRNRMASSTFPPRSAGLSSTGAASCACRDQAPRELTERIEAVIGGLGLSHVRDRLVKDGLSGGQRKRVSIGMEVVSKPRMLMLDEPSSGLDSSTAHRILEMVLATSRQEHCTTFTTIHQPRWNTLRLFDMLVLLCPGGHLCFAGPVSVAHRYFSEALQLDFPPNENPADVMIDVCTFESARKMALEGLWRNPPQCLRAVLFPTPEAVDEEWVAPWQQDEFGRTLALLWEDFSSVRLKHIYGCTDQDTFTVESAGADARSRSSSQVSASSSGSGACPSGVVVSPRGGSASAATLVLTGQAPPATRATAAASTAASAAAATAAAVSSVMPSPTRMDERRSSWSSVWAHEQDDALTTEARERGQVIHWAQQIWMHVARSLLITSRALCPVLAMNIALLMASLYALGWAFPVAYMDHVFLQNGLMLLLLCLAQSVAAQRLFGGEERTMAWREASVCSPSQVLYSFIGKDMASLVEIALAAMCFTLVYWPIGHTYASGSDLFAIGFACLYAIWGLNHIWAIAMPQHAAMLLAVVMSFLSFLFAGLKPEAYVLARTLNGYGSLLLLMSPVRWALSHFLFRHVTGRGATYTEGEVKAHVQHLFSERGYDINKIQCPNLSVGIMDRWANHEGWVCHSGQLFLLGFLFRLLALLILVLIGSKRAAGGQLPLGVLSSTRSRLLQDCIGVFLVGLTVLNVWLLGFTY